MALLPHRRAGRRAWDFEKPKKELLDYAEQMGFEVAGASENLVSSLVFERPGLAECMKAAETGKMDVIVVKSLSRIGRDIEGTLHFLRQLNQLYSPLEGASLFPNHGVPNHGPAMKME